MIKRKSSPYHVLSDDGQKDSSTKELIAKITSIQNKVARLESKTNYLEERNEFLEQKCKLFDKRIDNLALLMSLTKQRNSQQVSSDRVY